MADSPEDTPNTTLQSRPTPLGIYDRPQTEMFTSIEVIALAVSAVWLMASAIFFLVLPGDAESGGSGAGALRFIMTIIAVFMPVGMIWVAATAARASKVMREESQRLQSAIDAIRQTYIAQSQAGAMGAEPSSVARKLDEQSIWHRVRNHRLDQTRRRGRTRARTGSRDLAGIAAASRLQNRPRRQMAPGSAGPIPSHQDRV